MSIISNLSEKALQDKYLQEIFYKAEKINAQKLFDINIDKLTEKEFTDLLRFSDLLSRSQDSDAQNRAYKIISLLVENNAQNPIFQIFANSVMVKLGNFPALNLLENPNTNTKIQQPYETLFTRAIKETYQEIPNSEYTFTDPQYKIFESLKDSNHYSFSGPTSLGKSFIINAFIGHLIKEHRGTDNIVILVPSRALINQTVAKLKNKFKNSKDYIILSHPTVPPIFRQANKHYIFVFTPERLISYFSDTSNPKLDYVFIDEAHKIIAQNDARSPIYYHAIFQADRRNIKLYFASPNIQNPEVFLQLFKKNTDEKITIKTLPVAQNRYFLDLIDKRCLMFSDTNHDYKISIDIENKEINFWLDKLGYGNRNIVYCNSKFDTIDYAIKFSENKEDKDIKELNEVIELIKEHLHKQYYLIDCLKKGIV